MMMMTSFLFFFVFLYLIECVLCHSSLRYQIVFFVFCFFCVCVREILHQTTKSNGHTILHYSFTFENLLAFLSFFLSFFPATNDDDDVKTTSREDKCRLWRRKKYSRKEARGLWSSEREEKEDIGEKSVLLACRVEATEAIERNERRGGQRSKRRRWKEREAGRRRRWRRLTSR